MASNSQQYKPLNQHKVLETNLYGNKKLCVVQIALFCCVINNIFVVYTQRSWHTIYCLKVVAE